MLTNKILYIIKIKKENIKYQLTDHVSHTIITFVLQSVLTAMISRRNIRAKVMQTLYTLSTLENEIKPGEPQKLLQQHFDQTRSLFIYLIYFLTEVTRYAERDSHKRAGKHLPDAADLNVNVKIAGNELLWKMLEDPALKEQFSLQKPEQTNGFCAPGRRMPASGSRPPDRTALARPCCSPRSLSYTALLRAVASSHRQSRSRTCPGLRSGP